MCSCLWCLEAHWLILLMVILAFHHLHQPLNTKHLATCLAVSDMLAHIPDKFHKSTAALTNGFALLRWRYANTSSDDCCIITFSAHALEGLINKCLVIPQRQLWWFRKLQNHFWMWTFYLYSIQTVVPLVPLVPMVWATWPCSRF